MKQLKVVVTPQVEALRTTAADESGRSLATKADKTDQRAQLAVLHTQALIGGFRKCQADDPEIYFRTVEHTLARYDVEIQRELADASKWEYPPTPFELRQACERLANERAHAVARDENLRKQFEERRRLDALQAERKALPSYRSRDSPPAITKAELDRREAEQILARYEATAKASARPAELSIFELDPADWNA
jgi:hypothetical protein